MTLVDLTKALDTVSRDGLMAKFGCPPRFIAMVWQYHDGMQARVQNDGEYSESFEVTNLVKQCCVMAPTLFSYAHEWFSTITVINSPTWRALSPEQGTLMMRSLPELKKQVWHLEDSVHVCM